MGASRVVVRLTFEALVPPDVLEEGVLGDFTQAPFDSSGDLERAVEAELASAYKYETEDPEGITVWLASVRDKG